MIFHLKLEAEPIDLREIETLERPDVRDLFERGPPFLTALTALRSSY